MFTGIGLVLYNKEIGCLEPNLSPNCRQLDMINTANEFFSLNHSMEVGSRAWKLYRTKNYRRLEVAHNKFLQ